MHFILPVSFTVCKLLIVNCVLLKSNVLHTRLLNIQLYHLFCCNASVHTECCLGFSSTKKKKKKGQSEVQDNNENKS